jgi:protein-disulfide isomerase
VTGGRVRRERTDGERAGLNPLRLAGYSHAMPKLRAAFVGVALLSAGSVGCGGAALAAPSAASTPPRPPSASPAPVAAPGEDDAVVPITSHDATWGRRTALVTIVEFADLQCADSARVEATLNLLRDEFGPDELRIVWKNDPLERHPDARAAAEAAAGVFDLGGADAFWKFAERAFADRDNLRDANFVTWAADAGVTDVAAFRAGIAARRWAGVIDADHKEAKALDVFATPTFFVNGVYLSGARHIASFRALIDKEHAKAAARVAAGTPRVRVYAEAARDNFPNNPPRHPDGGASPPESTAPPRPGSPLGTRSHA